MLLLVYYGEQKTTTANNKSNFNVAIYIYVKEETALVEMNTGKKKKLKHIHTYVDILLFCL